MRFIQLRPLSHTNSRIQRERNIDKIDTEGRRRDGEVQMRACAKEEDKRHGRTSYYQDFRSSDEYGR